MTLIFGGAYMGKRDYAKAHLGVKRVEECNGTLPNFHADCVAGLEKFSLACARQKQDSAEILKQNESLWKDKVLVVQDLSCGVVPMDPVERAWREENGRMLRLLAQRADHVVRVWYALPQVIK